VHGSVFKPDGQVSSSPYQIGPLSSLEVREQGNRVQILGSEGRRGIPCSDVIVATHLPGATQILKQSPGVSPGLLAKMGRLRTTPVVVVRLWFKPEAPIPTDLEAAFVPRSTFIDNFFHLNRFDSIYNLEGQVIEVHSCRAHDTSKEQVLDRVFADLETFCPDLKPEFLVDSVVQSHPDVFTLYSPGASADRPGTDAGVAGLHLAGDWTRSDRPVWMMERGVVSGIAAANRVLRSRGLEPEKIRELAPEALLLTAVRWLARGLRRLFWPQNFPSAPSSRPGSRAGRRRTRRPDR
jgi:predicted NAD/FAD-dependent oxidoreductase